MSKVTQMALADTLEYLLALQRDGVKPKGARERLQALRARHPELGIDLLSEEQAFDESFHYDVLLRDAGRGTASLSWCAESALPWPMRGVHRISEGDLVSVNATYLTIDRAIAYIDFIWDEAPITERIVNSCLIEEELQRSPIEVTDAELQEAMDAFRATKGMFTAQDTHAWLERRGMTQEALESLVAEQVLLRKVRERAVGEQVEPYFEVHSRDFDVAKVARFVVGDESEAREIAGRLRGGRASFLETAEQRFVKERGDAGLFAAIERRAAEPALAKALFWAAPGELIGPVPVENGFALMRVLSIEPARLDARLRMEIAKLLFDEWLAERRRNAKIDWHWGNAQAAAA